MLSALVSNNLVPEDRMTNSLHLTAMQIFIGIW